MPTFGTNIAIIENDQILLIKNADFGAWGLPGGRMEAGETFPQCAIREAFEETGLHVELLHLVGIYSLPLWHHGGNHTILFTARSIGGEKLQNQSKETLDIRFFDPDTLPEDILWWHQRRIKDAIASINGSVVYTQDAIWPETLPLSLEDIELRRNHSIKQKDPSFWIQHPGPEAERREL
jgi:ADP-ribose pyrophosphatase YjhB (NUDIX family)